MATVGRTEEIGSTPAASVMQGMASGASATNPKRPLFKAQVQNRQRQFRVYSKSVASFCAAILKALDQPAWMLSIAFVDACEMRVMNCRYLGRNFATDVLSFPYRGVIMEGMPFLGEIVIAPEVAQRHALRYRTSHEREIRRLLVHGILHLLGYDHEKDKGEMNRLQDKLLQRQLFLNSPPIGDLKVDR